MKFGKAFSDNVIVAKKAVRRSDEVGSSWWSGTGRVLLFSTLLLIVFFILLSRLFTLTIIRGHYFRQLADGNRTRELVRHAPRGLLLDRTGKPLVANIPQYRFILPCPDNASTTCTRFISQEEGDQLTREGLGTGQFLEVDYLRRYLFESTSHVTGYTGELTAAELKDEYYMLRNYLSGDRIGRTGAEALFEERLRGRDGRDLVEVDAQGNTLRVLGHQEEIPGENITLSLDSGISEAASRAFPAGEKGAIVVAKPATGEILAIYSSPSFSVNALTLGMSEGEFKTLLENPDQPMFNRAIGGVYPPGSTFKIVTAIAGLEEGAIDKDTKVEDTGVISIPPFTFPNWYFTQYGKTEGLVDIVKGIRRSNDIFFYRVGEWTGITKLVKWARTLGLGKPLGIELFGEASGLMPDPVWKAGKFSTPADREARNDEWYLGDTYHVAIGQGYLLVSPLQVNTWTNVVAADRKLCRPTIIKGEDDCEDLGIKKETIDLIIQGMKEACEPGGTGWPLFTFTVKDQAVPVACKTGTAEFGDPNDRTHAWFTAYAPIENPELSVTVLVEGAGEGSDVAAPIAKQVLTEWFER